MDRLKQVVSHLIPQRQKLEPKVHYKHELNPTFFLHKTAQINPDGLAVLHHTAKDVRLERTYAVFAERSKDLAYFLRERCFARGNRTVALLASNTPMVLESYFAIVAAGGVFAAVNYRLQKHEIQYIVTHSGAGTVIVDREYYPMVADMEDLTIIVDEDADGVTGQYEDCLRAGRGLDRDGQGWEGLIYEHADEDETIGICYTSGTTGKPKGVEYTHRGVYLGAVGNLIDSSLNCADVFGNNACRYLWTLPMFHAAGWVYPWAVTLAQGTHICLRRMDYGLIWKLLVEERVTNMCCAPTVCTLLMAHESARRLDRPVRVTIAASPPSPSLFKQLIEHNFAPVHVYGLTETYGPVMRSNYLPAWNDRGVEERYRLMARQGHGFSTARAAKVLVTDEATGKLREVRRDATEMGELVLHGNIVMKGYLNDAEATKKTFTEDKYFLTGDLAVMHPDGSVDIQDRGKDIIISGGENISSIDTESALLQHPKILECAVVAQKDEKWGEIPVAFVTLRSADVTTEEILSHTRKLIAGYKMPKRIVIVDELPKTSTGKVRKNELRDRLK